ncbi:Holo-(acyl-carrier-protein) synthase [Syntrophobacter sp. SbD1]|nr:Holo-(acyl-carrier-protein) synthase [Syntrophobacter sp. SbD1]
MPIYGIGIDLVKVDRLKQILDRWGERFEIRVFTEFEREYCSARRNRTGCLALRFAAKEAFVKALGLGMRHPVLWKDIEVRPDTLGKPEISLTPGALEYCTQKGIRSWHLSLTDEGDYGAAVVVIET